LHELPEVVDFERVCVHVAGN